MTKSKMAVLSGTFALSQTKDKYILISLMFVSHLVFALDASLADQKVDLLDRHRRAVTTYSVSLPSAVPENVCSSSVLYNLTILYPSRYYVITNNSAGVQGLFQISRGILTLMPSLAADTSKLFDYEKFHTIQVMINATNQTDPSDVVMLTVTIPLSDVNDEPPVITNKPKPLLATLPGNPQPGRVVFTVTATDPDFNSDLIFSIDLVTSSDSANTQRFVYQANSGGNIGEKLFNIVITGAGALQSGAEYTIKFSVTDRYTVSGSPQTTDTLVVRVGNRAPQFYETSYKGRIYENMTPATTNWVLEADSNNKLGIQVKQFQAGNALTFQLLLANGQPSQMFNIQAEDGVQRIVNKISIDYEVTKYESLFIQVREAGTGLTSSVAITINIIDENDNNPAFYSAQYSTTISENAAINSTVLMVTASDVDSGLNGEIVFSIVNNMYFGVTTAAGSNAYIGTVTVKSRLDYDSGQSPIQFFVIASDKGAPVRSVQVPVSVTLQNVNDNPPTIVNTTSTINLNETTPLQSVVTIFQASDIDGDAVKFYFKGKIPTFEIFTIRDTNGQMTLTSTIPKEKSSYILEVIAVDDDSCCASKNGYLTATATFTVNIIDVNVNKPFFNSCLVYDTTASVKEGSPVGTTVIQVSASDPDRGDNGKVIYRIEPADPNAIFQIDPNTGNITVKGNIVRDQSGFVQVTVVARNPPALPLMEGRCTFRVNIIDINNNPPTFSQPVYEIPVSLSTRPPAILYQMAAQDKDVGQNANITYTLGPSDNITMTTFSINFFTGVISLDSVLDSGTLVYYLTVIANDNGKDPGPLTGTANVTIKVNTDGGKPPEWINLPANQTFSVSENALRGYVITTLACATNGTGLEFRVYDAVSAITSDSKNFMAVTFVDNGVSHMNLTLRAVLNYEVQTEYKLSVVCQSVVGQVVLRAPLYTVVINVLDANDEVPEFQGLDANGRYSASVFENSPPLTSFFQISANDKDTNPPFNVITFTLDGPNKDLFQVNNLGGNRADILTGNGSSLDREVIPYYALLIVASDGAPASPGDLNNASLPNTASRYIDVTVNDVNDNPPVFNQTLYTFNISENAAVTDFVGIVTANDPDDVDKGLGLQYRFIDGNVNNAFNIFSVTGAIRVAKKLDYENPQEPKIYNITLMALDQNQLHNATTKIQIVLLDENDNRPVFSPLLYSVKNVVTEENKTVTPQNPQFLVTVKATDADVNRPQTSIRYSIFGTSDVASLFTVDPISGNVSLIGSLDRDIPPFYYTVTVEARDEIVNPLSSFADVQVYPMDINDNTPVFNPQFLQGSVLENSVNTLVMTVLATDKDDGENGTVNYRIDPVQINALLSAMFTVNTTGDIYTTNNVTLLDRETIDKILLVVQAYDMGNPSRFDSATATITILDANDQSPYFENQNYSASMSEHQIAGPVMSLSAIDLDSDPKNKALTFYLPAGQNGSNFFSLQSINNVATISVKQAIDYERDPHLFIFTLTVTDGAVNHINSTTLYITVLDYNDNPPVFVNPVQSVIRQEEEPVGQVIATFNATDQDKGINAEIVYSILRASDPFYEIYINSTTGVVTNRKKLDRERHATMTIIILATDKGEIPLTGTGTLSITLTDINDNGPQFLEDYRPVIPENKDNSNTEVVVIYATDPDTPENGPPFGFIMSPSCDPKECSLFTLTFNPAGDGNKGTATITTSSRFDREVKKYYYLPIVMWDRNGMSNSVTGTNTLTIIIGDDNDNELQPGNQDIWIQNYEGQFIDYEIGRVYTDDPDDWDLPDKTFTYNSPDNLKSYFSIDPASGMITHSQGLYPNYGMDPYKFTVNVYDKKYQKTVTCTVSVTIQIVTDEAVRKSGGVRLQGITAEEFIKPISATEGSRYQKFRIAVASMLGYPGPDNVQIMSLNDGKGFLDVRFSTHGSPYLNPSQGESAIMLNLVQFEQQVGLQVLKVPINLCMDETTDIGCYNFFNVTNQPELVNANGTSFVMSKTDLTAEEGCVDFLFPDPPKCQGDYCFNGGTCLMDDWGKLSCACNPGFDGPRCQQSRHSFDGRSASFYEGLSVCSGGRTSIDFITLQDDGLIMYSGPLTAIDPTQNVLDYLILELRGGYPSLQLNLGREEAFLLMTGRDQNNAVIMPKLSDGQWHHLDIDRDNQKVTVTVDHCKYAVATNGKVADWSPCRMSGTVPGYDILLNVPSLLQLGGRYPSSTSTAGFNGSLKNLVHNTKLYDLYYKEVPKWNSGTNGCPREDGICVSNTGQPVCGLNGTCVARWQPDETKTCLCNPGWYGAKCAKVAPTMDLQTNSYLAWDIKPTLITDTGRAGSFQLMYRTRQVNGTLFALTNAALKTIILSLVNGKLSLSYDMGQGLNNLELPNAPANTGQWSTVRVERYGNEFLLAMDGGEGRNYNYRIPNTDLLVFFTILPRVTMGALVSNGNQLDNDLINTCVRDIRYNDNWLPMTSAQNSDPDAGGTLFQSQGVVEGCVRNDCGPSVVCVPPTVCYPLWEKYECRCGPGNASINGVCMPSCNPNPCLNSGICNMVNGVPKCICSPYWTGAICGTQAQTDDAGLGAGAIVGIVLAILFLLILLILLLIFLLTRKRSEKEKFIVDDPDDDFIRENVVFYDEEGAGEEDHAAYDISLLQKPARETNAKPLFNPGTEDEMRRRNAPQLDRLDVAPRSDRPDVGSFIKDRISDAENDDPINDSTRQFNYEGGNSDAGSLSSLNTSSSGGSQDYDYLSNWGPKFAKLADMYGAGQNQDDV